MPAQFEYNHVIHPTILDAAMQSTSLAVGRRSEVGATVVCTNHHIVFQDKED